MDDKNKTSKKSWFKERGFTDKLYFLNLTLSWLFITICIVITLFSGKLGIIDLSVISVGVPAVFAELGIHTGFVIWKAKTENISKFGYDPDNGYQLTNAIGFRVESEEEEDVPDDNNFVHNDVDTGRRSNVSPDRSNKKGVSEFRERILGKYHRFN